MTNWQYFPRSRALPEHLSELLAALEPGFEQVKDDPHSLESDDVLAVLAPYFASVGYQVETGKKKSELIARPVLFGPNGSVEKSFNVDAFHAPTGTVVEIEAGRGVVNHQFLKDFFEACAMQDAVYLVIGIMNGYSPKSAKTPAKDFQTVTNFFDTLYASERLQLPLQGVLIIGYDNTGKKRPKGGGGTTESSGADG